MKLVAIILVFLVIVSCENTIRFETPQPKGQEDERSIPKKMVGKYLNMEDSSELIIGLQQIVKKSIIHFSSPLALLDSIDKLRFKGDTSFSEIAKTGEISKTDFVVKRDSLFIRHRIQDTMFSFLRGDVLRKFKGYYFLSHQGFSNNWQVTKLARTKRGIILGYVASPNDLENLRQLTESKSDTIYNFNPTRKQFRKFIRKKGFAAEEIFVREE